MRRDHTPGLRFITLHLPPRVAPSPPKQARCCFFLLIRVELKGARASVQINIDGSDGELSYKGPASDFTGVRSMWQVGSKSTFGLATYQSTVRFHSVRIRPLSQKLDSTTPPSKERPPKIKPLKSGKPPKKRGKGKK